MDLLKPVPAGAARKSQWTFHFDWLDFATYEMRHNHNRLEFYSRRAGNLRGVFRRNEHPA